MAAVRRPHPLVASLPIPTATRSPSQPLSNAPLPPFAPFGSVWDAHPARSIYLVGLLPLQPNPHPQSTPLLHSPRLPVPDPRLAAVGVH